jgi:hypothetical protein
MDDPALQPRLDAIERRQSYILTLLAGGYVLAGTWFLVETVPAVTVWNAGLGVLLLVFVTSTIGVYRRRQART